MRRPRSKHLVRYLVPFFCLLLFSAAMLSASLTRPPDPGKPSPPPDQQVSPRYTQFCSSCHGLDGTGYGPSAYDARRGEFFGELSVHRPADLSCPGISLAGDGALEQVVRGGISCKEHGQVMPAFPDLTGDQFAEIAAQVRAFSHLHGEHGPSESGGRGDGAHEQHHHK